MYQLKIVQREKHGITRFYSAELQTAKQTLTTLKNLRSLTKIDQHDGFRPPQEPIRLQDMLNSARSRAEKKITSYI